MRKIPREKLESLIIQCIEDLPNELKTKLENINIVIEDSHQEKSGSKEIMLGLYQGVPFSMRGFWYGNVLPDKITIFKNNIESLCNSEDEIESVVRKVVIHEFAHYFGFDEEDIRERGY